ncbi:Glutathione peroxidase [Phytophthora infestans]|uniref:Glutathione peroxidase n=1 Tax=Phytophthora infestans TaxID=4787 RepID=A0A8S9UA16_PHYIN|nr:Glutathione peroxidase [Phytophthora infestans]
MAASRRVLRLQRSPLLTARIQSLVSIKQSHENRCFSSATHGFSNVLQFATIQPSNGQLTPQDFRFKAALVVNTASKCGHAGQLKQLQALHEKYSEQGLIVVAVPSNDFAGQEPGKVDDILKRYADCGVTFAIAERTPVAGDKAHPFFKKIADKYSTSVAPTWNFDKFLVDHRGDMRAVFPNDTEPLVTEVIAEIEEVLEDLPRGIEPGQELEDEYDYEEEDSDDESDEEGEDGEDNNRRYK